jgi:hypothetical protein
MKIIRSSLLIMNNWPVLRNKQLSIIFSGMPRGNTLTRFMLLWNKYLFPEKARLKTNHYRALRAKDDVSLGFI